MTALFSVTGKVTIDYFQLEIRKNVESYFYELIIILKIISYLKWQMYVF